MEYFVNSNLNHDGQEYKRGDTINLSELTAAPLVSAGVIGTEAIETSQVEVPVVEEPTPEATVGGDTNGSGEPSLATEVLDEQTEAADITPETSDETPRRRRRAEPSAVEEAAKSL